MFRFAKRLFRLLIFNKPNWYLYLNFVFFFFWHRLFVVDSFVNRYLQKIGFSFSKIVRQTITKRIVFARPGTAWTRRITGPTRLICNSGFYLFLFFTVRLNEFFDFANTFRFCTVEFRFALENTPQITRARPQRL